MIKKKKKKNSHSNIHFSLIDTIGNIGGWGNGQKNFGPLKWGHCSPNLHVSIHRRSLMQITTRLQ